MLEATLFDAVRPWLIAATGIPECIMAHPGAPRPSTDYVLFNVISSYPVRRAENDEYSDNPDYSGTEGNQEPEFVYQNREHEWTVSINIYAKGSIDYANKVHVWQQTAQGREQLAPVNPFSITRAIRLPELINEVWHDRATFDMVFRAYVNEHEIVDGETTVPLGRVKSDLIEEGQFTTQDVAGPAATGSYSKP